MSASTRLLYTDQTASHSSWRVLDRIHTGPADSSLRLSSKDTHLPSHTDTQSHPHRERQTFLQHQHLSHRGRHNATYFEHALNLLGETHTAALRSVGMEITDNDRVLFRGSEDSDMESRQRETLRCLLRLRKCCLQHQQANFRLLCRFPAVRIRKTLGVVKRTSYSLSHEPHGSLG